MWGRRPTNTKPKYLEILGMPVFLGILSGAQCRPGPGWMIVARDWSSHQTHQLLANIVSSHAGDGISIWIAGMTFHLFPTRCPDRQTLRSCYAELPNFRIFSQPAVIIHNISWGTCYFNRAWLVTERHVLGKPGIKTLISDRGGGNAYLHVLWSVFR